MPRRSWSKRRSPITGDLTVIAVPSGLGAGDPKTRTPLTIFVAAGLLLSWNSPD